MSDMRQDDRVSTVTFTLPAGHQWTTVEAALREAHDREYELRMAFFWRCQYLEAKVAALTKAGDAMVDMVDWEVPYERRKNLEAAWNTAKEPEAL
jgi:hypothetical protein